MRWREMWSLSGWALAFGGVLVIGGFEDAAGTTVGAADVVSRHVERLSDSKPSQAIRAAEALGALGERAAKAAPDLVRALVRHAAKSDGVSRAAAFALVEIGDPAVSSLLVEMASDRWMSKVYARLALSTIVRRSDNALSEVVSNWVRRITSSKPGDHRFVRDVTASCGAEGSKVIAELLKHPHPQVREGAVIMLGQCVEVGSNAVAALVNELDRTRSGGRFGPRFEVVTALGASRSRDPKVRSALLAHLKDPEETTRKASLWALGMTGPDALPVLLANLGNGELGRIARTSLGRLGPEALPAFNEILQNRSMDLELRTECFNAIVSLPDSTDGLWDAVQACVDDPDFERRASGFLRRLLEPPELYLALAKSMDDATPLVRRWAAVEIADHAGSAVVCQEPLLRHLRSDPDDDVRGASAYALGRLGVVAAVQPLRAALLELDGESAKEAVVIALGRLGESAAPAARELVDCLENRETTLSWYRKRVAEAFTSIGADALPELFGRLDSSLHRNVSVADVATCIAAIEAGWPSLRAKVEGGNEDQAAEIATALALAGDVSESLGAALVAGLRSDDVRVVREAAAGLGAMGKAARDHVDQLLVAAEEPEEDTRVAVFRAIEAIRPRSRKVRKQLKDMLEREGANPATRGLIVALASTGYATKDLDVILTEGAPHKIDSACEALGLFDPPSKDVQALLVRELSASREYTRKKIIETIAGLDKPGESVIEALRKAAFYDDSKTIQLQAQEALLECGWFEATDLPWIVYFIEKGNFAVVVGLIRALESMGEEAALAVPILARQSIIDNYDDRVIGAIGGRRSEPYGGGRPSYIRLGRTESFRDIRLAAIRALGAIGPAAFDARPELERNARDTDLEIAEAARAAIDRMSR